MTGADTMTKEQAEYLVKLFKGSRYQARKIRGKWCVWYPKSDHAVEFDKATLERAKRATQGV